MRLKQNRVCNALSSRAVCREPVEDDMKDITKVSKDLEPLAALAYEQGWTISLNPQGKLVWKSPDKAMPLVYTSTSTNGRGLKNTKAQLIRSGLDVSSLQPEKTTAELAAEVREELPQVAAQVDALVGSGGNYDEAMAVFLAHISVGISQYVEMRGLGNDDSLEQAVKLLEEAEKERSRLVTQVEDLKEQTRKINIECTEAKRNEAAALERAVAAENKFTALKRLLND